MRLYVSEVDKEKRRDDLLARFVRKHTAEMAPPPPTELKNIQDSLHDSLLALKRQLNSELPSAIPTFARIERETNNLFIEVDRIRIREQDTLDALQSVVEENESVSNVRGRRSKNGNIVNRSKESGVKMPKVEADSFPPPAVEILSGSEVAQGENRYELESVHNDMMKDMIGIQT